MKVERGGHEGGSHSPLQFLQEKRNPLEENKTNKQKKATADMKRKSKQGKS